MKALIILLLATSVAHAQPSAISFEELHRQFDGDRTRREESAGSAAGLAQGFAWARMGVEAVGNFHDFVEAFQALANGDASCIDLSDLGAPAIPTNCHQDEEEEGTCAQCFMQAYRRLDGMRLNLERLRCTYGAAKRGADAAVAFGDNVSGITGAAALSWQAQRRGIVKAIEDLKGTYDLKYSQMIPNLKASLEAIGECEGRYFNENDWFSRFGFIYFTFMKDRYKRAD